MESKTKILFLDSKVQGEQSREKVENPGRIFPQQSQAEVEGTSPTMLWLCCDNIHSTFEQPHKLIAHDLDCFTVFTEHTHHICLPRISSLIAVSAENTYPGMRSLERSRSRVVCSYAQPRNLPVPKTQSRKCVPKFGAKLVMKLFSTLQTPLMLYVAWAFRMGDLFIHYHTQCTRIDA